LGKPEKSEGIENPEKSREEIPEKNSVEGGLDFFEQEIGLLDIVGPKAKEIIGQDLQYCLCLCSPSVSSCCR
jgi:4-aminobutyrate aminotransferase